MLTAQNFLMQVDTVRSDLANLTGSRPEILLSSETAIISCSDYRGIHFSVTLSAVGDRPTAKVAKGFDPLNHLPDLVEFPALPGYLRSEAEKVAT